MNTLASAIPAPHHVSPQTVAVPGHGISPEIMDVIAPEQLCRYDGAAGCSPDQGH